ncbi:MAG: hypothetical protein ACI936_004074 [Paraglaciecola sp.]|jgi:hypothetical protein
MSETCKQRVAHIRDVNVCFTPEIRIGINKSDGMARRRLK